MLTVLSRYASRTIIVSSLARVRSGAVSMRPAPGGPEGSASDATRPGRPVADLNAAGRQVHACPLGLCLRLGEQLVVAQVRVLRRGQHDLGALAVRPVCRAIRGLHGVLSGQGVLYATLGVRQRPRAASTRATEPRRTSISRASARGRTRRWQARTWRSISSAVAPWFRYSATARANVRTGRSPRLLLQRTQAVTRFAG